MKKVPVRRESFPILKERVNGRELVYLDNAATTQKPSKVIEKINECYSRLNANVHRGVYYLSEKCTREYENSRKLIQRFINAKRAEEVVFVRGATEAINMVALGMRQLEYDSKGTYMTTMMEHHSNYVPWQQLCLQTGDEFQVIPVDGDGEIQIDVLANMLSERVRLLAVTYVSNVLGTVNPIKEIVSMAHRYGIPVLVDGTQAVQHLCVDVQDLDCDFFCFSGHKMYGPTGIGVLYGKKEWLERLKPSQFGGEMVDIVDESNTTFQPIPLCFEAGTPNYVGSIALGEAIKFIDNIGSNEIENYEAELLHYAKERLMNTGCVELLGNPKNQAASIAFTIKGIHSYDAAMMLDKLGIAVRSGNHCAQPLLRHFGKESVLRMSVACYTTYDEIDALCDGICFLKKFMLHMGG